MDNMNKKEEIKAGIQQAVVAFNRWNQMTTLEKLYFPEREPLLFKEHARVMDQFFAHFTPVSALELLDKLEAAEKLITELDKRLIEYAEIATREARRAAELEKYRTAFMEWHNKTAWVQSDKRFDVVHPLGKHRADILGEYIKHLEREKDAIEAVALALRDDMRDAREKLEAAERRIAELESYSKTAIEFREAARDENRHLKLSLEAVEGRVIELEARQIALPQRLSPEGYHIDEAYMVDDSEGEYLDRDAVIEAISAAGIKVKGE